MSVDIDPWLSLAAETVSPGDAEIPQRYEFVALSHCLPIVQVPTGAWQERPGALPTVLRPVVAARSGAWVGWAGTPDAYTAPVHHDGMWLHPVPLNRTEITDHVLGQCESTIAPLYHNAVVHPVFHRRWCEAYRTVNDRFAQVAAQIAAPGGVVWVHDYHLQLVPASLRELRPDLLIGFFLHAPFPPPELFAQMPLRSEITAGLLGADVIGFQHHRAADNFLTQAQTLLAAGVQHGRVRWGNRTVTVDAFPQSVDTQEITGRAARPAVRAAAAGLRVGLGRPATVLLGVDRLHPAKGIEERLTAFDELLDERRLDPADTVLVQVIAPDPAETGFYQELRARLERQVGQINGKYGRVGHPILHYLYRTLDRIELVRLYRAADVMVATPMCDGMSLTAKEYVSARLDDSGAVVLSEFTATADDLPQAHIVNPHDIDAVKAAIVRAATSDPAHLHRRMAAMREQVRDNDLQRWAGRLMSALGRCAGDRPYPAAPARTAHRRIGVVSAGVRLVGVNERGRSPEPRSRSSGH